MDGIIRIKSIGEVHRLKEDDVGFCGFDCHPAIYSTPEYPLMRSSEQITVGALAIKETTVYGGFFD